MGWALAEKKTTPAFATQTKTGVIPDIQKSVYSLPFLGLLRSSTSSTRPYALAS